MKRSKSGAILTVAMLTGAAAALTAVRNTPQLADKIAREIRSARNTTGVAGTDGARTVRPVSDADAELRAEVAQAIYSHPALERYANESTPPIHVIVQGGQVALLGVVDTAAEKEIAGMRAAMAVASLGQVSNYLRVEIP